GRDARPLAAATTGTAASTGAPHTPGAPAGAGKPLRAARLRLVGAGGQALELGVRTELGRHLARQLGPDAAVWDSLQVVLDRGADGRWQAVPVAGTTNETLLNGAALTAPRPLSEGDVLAVGRQAKAVVKLPLTLHGV